MRGRNLGSSQSFHARPNPLLLLPGFLPFWRASSLRTKLAMKGAEQETAIALQVLLSYSMWAEGSDTQREVEQKGRGSQAEPAPPFSKAYKSKELLSNSAAGEDSSRACSSTKALRKSFCSTCS